MYCNSQNNDSVPYASCCHSLGKASVGALALKELTSADFHYHGKPVIVNITISGLIIRSIDESDMSFSVITELWQSWNDKRLNYPPWAPGAYQVLDSMWKKKLWNPMLYFVNSVDGKVDEIITPSSFFWLTKQSNVFYFCRIVVKLICEMDLKLYPHDEQKCGIKLSSAIFNSKQVILRWNSPSNKLKQFSSLQQFKIINVEMKECILLSNANNNMSCLEKTILLHRRGGYYLINIYIPTVLIVIMSMLTFWIPPEAVPARVTLGVTSLLTIITKQYQASMPNVSYIVAMNIWLSSCVAFVFFSLLEFAIVIAMNTKTKTQSSLPGDKDFVLPLVMLKANGTWSMKNSWGMKPGQESNKTSRRIDFFSRIFFPLSFVVFCISYWRCYS
ncbi:glutamate-gated chloride channel alpha-like [Uloborus diversus]|uniref:glutamate-gated chloride channel alpha-like n=1 Tax=Uloborus diversus TaxID=327109 RepID=UPI00240977F1|nr:glutamate-gated chloride channel alpha-like [Uloborus diversus]